MSADLVTQVTSFLLESTRAMGLSLEATVVATENGPHIDLSGEGADTLLQHRGEPLKALQHVVDMAFSRAMKDDERVFVDCMGYRHGKDLELKQMARFLAQKSLDTGVEQQIGPLNPYERRLVHMAVAEVPGAASESIGDAFSKTVLISRK